LEALSFFDDGERKGLYGEGEGCPFHFLNKLECLPQSFFLKNLITCSEEFCSPVVRGKLYIVGVGC